MEIERNDYLEEAFLISKANRYDIKGRKYIGANLKNITCANKSIA